MKNIKIINGPNLNLLGKRETDIYGDITYSDLCDQLQDYSRNSCNLEIYQSNHEGEIVDYIQEACYLSGCDGVIINAAAYTHTSVAIRDALEILKAPIVEVHISDINKREKFRQFSYIKDLAKTHIIGKGVKGYFDAIDYLLKGSA